MEVSALPLTRCDLQQSHVSLGLVFITRKTTRRGFRPSLFQTGLFRVRKRCLEVVGQEEAVRGVWSTCFARRNDLVGFPAKSFGHSPPLP